ncbi:MAG: M1 family aminopeptidase, partial [Gemmatimonadota bacterium]
MIASLARLLLLALTLPPSHHPAPRRGVSTPELPADSYLDRYAEVSRLQPVRTQVARVSGLVLDRDVGHFTLDEGTLTLLTPVGGRTVGAIFHGRGTFTFVPPNPVERNRLIRFEKRDSLSDEFADLVLLFTDTTLAELNAQLTFGPGPEQANAGSVIRSALGYLGDDGHKAFDPDFMADFLNGSRSGQFSAYIDRVQHGTLLFSLNPAETESVRLWGMKLHGFYTRDAEVITQFHARGYTPDPQSHAERRNRVEVEAYRIEAWLPQNGGGDLAWSAAAHLDLAAVNWQGPWVAFILTDRLKADSARLDDGRSAAVFKGRDDELLWIRLPEPFEPGTRTGLTLYYHGDLIRRLNQFFVLESTTGWYPVSLEYRAQATFDLTFHTPKWLDVASVGSRVDSTTADRMTTTRWVTSTPIRNASFNIGKFERLQTHGPASPSVTVLFASDAHGGLGFDERRMRDSVVRDVASALEFFRDRYGPIPVSHFTVTETIYGEGQAFPALIDLPSFTFQSSDRFGENRFFRAHEVAHQWWGIGVDYATYRDRWLSEGFSDFSAIWYLQSIRNDNIGYNATLAHWRANILLHRGERAPLSLGHRTRSSKDENGYWILVYEKGAWVLHMLRGLLRDLDTMQEDRFAGLMHQFFADHVGGRASTRDFQAAAEKAYGGSLDWFFDEWVDGSQIPTY